MRTCSTAMVAFSLWLGLVSPAASQGDAWKSFTSKEGRFTMMWPGMPKEQAQQVNTPAGQIKITMYVLEQGQAAFFATFNDYPADLVQKADPEALLNGARDGAVSNVNGTLTKEKKITIDSHPGREIDFEAQGKFVARSRVYLVKERLYQIMVLAPKDQGLPKGTDKFLDSFKLTK